MLLTGAVSSKRHFVTLRLPGRINLRKYIYFRFCCYGVVMHCDVPSKDTDSGLIPSRVKPMTLKLVFTAFLLDALH